jgi:hypothetical protein
MSIQFFDLAAQYTKYILLQVDARLVTLEYKSTSLPCEKWLTSVRATSQGIRVRTYLHDVQGQFELSAAYSSENLSGPCSTGNLENR